MMKNKNLIIILSLILSSCAAPTSSLETSQTSREGYIFYKMIENKELEFDEDVWIDGFYLLDNLAVKVRFLFYEITEKDNKTKLYRFDIYEKKEFEGKNRINNVILNSDIIKVWYNEEEKRLKKISLTFKSINYIINFDDEK